MNGNIYGAYVKFPKVSGKVEFNYLAMEIQKIYPDMLELKYPYFTSRNVSTRYFEKSMLNKEYVITDELTIFYSESKDKCVEWLQKQRDELIRDYSYNYNRLLESEVCEVEEK